MTSSKHARRKPHADEQQQQQQQQDESVLLCTTGYDRVIRFWEAPTGQCNRKIATGESQVNCLVISHDKKLLAAGGNPAIKIYSLSPFSSDPIQTLAGHTHNVVSVGFPKHQKWLFSGSEDGTIKVWDRRTGVCQRDKIVRDKKTFVNCAILHPNQGEIVCCDQSGTISIYDIAENKMRTSWKPEGKSIAIRSITASLHPSMIIAANNRGTCYVYQPTDKVDNSRNVTDEAKENNNHNNANAMTNAIINNDGENAMHRKTNQVTTHNTKADKHGMITLTHKISAHDSYCLKALLSPDSKYLATCSADTTVKIFDVSNNFALQSELRGHRKWVWDLAFSADSAYIVSASTDKTAQLWDVRKGQKIMMYDEHTKGVTCVALNDSSTV